MLRQNNTRIEPDSNGTSNSSESSPNGTAYGAPAHNGNVDIQRELNRIEEIILDSLHIPLTRRTLVDEEQLLDQLDLVRLNLPAAFVEAEEIVLQKEEILRQAEQYAEQIIAAAEQRADQILSEMDIVRQAEMEAQQIRQQVQEECRAIQEQTLAEIERMRLQGQQELVQIRARALEEAEDIQNGADDYADRVLGSIEQQLSDMLRVIRNGRQTLQEPTREPGTSQKKS